MAQQLETLQIHEGFNSGTLPDAIVGLRALEVLTLYDNTLRGALPSALARLRDLHWLDAINNQFASAMPEVLFSQLTKLVMLCLGGNELRGALPESVGALRSLNTLGMEWNHLQGSLPERVFEVATLENVAAGLNIMLTGTLPDSASCASGLQHLGVENNQLTGALPEAVATWTQLESLYTDDNLLRGALPESLSRLQSLAAFAIGNNDFVGSLPEATTASAHLVWMIVGGNRFEGTLPSSLGGVTDLYSIDASSFDMYGLTMSGTIPPALARCSQLQGFIVRGQKFRGAVPQFYSTFANLQLSYNALETLPSLHFLGSAVSQQEQAFVAMHMNCFSCPVPACEGLPTLSTVAAGNLFALPSVIPPWISRHERSSLLYANNQVAAWTAAKTLLVVLGAMLSLSAFSGTKQQIVQRALVSQHMFPSLYEEGFIPFQHQVLWHNSLHCLLGLALLPVALSDRSIWACPEFSIRVGAFMAVNERTHAVVALVWCLTCRSLLQLHSYDALLSKQAATTSSERGAASVAATPWSGARCCYKVVLLGLLWSLYLAVLPLLLAPSLFLLAAKTIPDFMNLTPQVALFVEGSAGSLQAFISSHFAWRLAQAMSQGLRALGAADSGTSMLRSVQTILTWWLLPAIVTVVLDGQCLGHWLDWWAPCTSKELLPSRFQTDLADNRTEIGSAQSGEVSQVFILLGTAVYPQIELCASSPDSLSMILSSACFQRVLWRLSIILCGKLPVSALFGIFNGLRAARHSQFCDLKTHLIVYIQLSLVVGPWFPVLSLLLCVCILVNYLTLLHHWDRIDALKTRPSYQTPLPAVVLPIVCSGMMELCLLRDYSLALCLWLLLALMVLYKATSRGLSDNGLNNTVKT